MRLKEDLDLFGMPLVEKFDRAIKTMGGNSVEIFKNPSRQEMKEIAQHNEARGFLVGNDLYVWSATGAIHHHVAEEMKFPRDAIALNIGVHTDGKSYWVNVSDWNVGGPWDHNPKVKEQILNHPMLKLVRDRGPEFEIGYFDEAIVGDWSEADKKAVGEAGYPNPVQDFDDNVDAVRGPKQAKFGEAKAPKITVSKKDDEIKVEMKGIGSASGHDLSDFGFWFEKEDDDESLPQYHTIFIFEHLEVDAKYQGKGYGRELVMALIKEVKKAKIPAIFMNASPMGAHKSLDKDELQKFYESCGFKNYEGHSAGAIMYMELQKQEMAETTNKTPDQADLDSAFSGVNLEPYKDAIDKGQYIEIPLKDAKKILVIHHNTYDADVEKFMKVMAADPIVLFQVGKKLYAHDGQHRLNFAIKNNLPSISAYVIKLDPIHLDGMENDGTFDPDRNGWTRADSQPIQVDAPW